MTVSSVPRIDESNVYYVYTTLAHDGLRIPMGDGGDIRADLRDQRPEPAEAGTRVRLHYPMVNVDGTRYMTEARVDPTTGQFRMYHIGVYSEGVSGGPPVRHVGEFEV